MNVRLRPEIEKLIQADLKRGAYNSVDEYVERAVAMLHQQEAWLAQNRDKISAQIVEGYAAAGRGELIEVDEVPSRMTERFIVLRISSAALEHRVCAQQNPGPL